MLNQLTARVVSEDRPVSGGHVSKNQESIAVEAVVLRNAIAGISYLIEEALTAMMTPGPDDGNPYDDSHMA